jgi:hypothetical protein
MMPNSKTMVCALLGLLLVGTIGAGCSQSSQPTANPPAGAWIKADPNPVPAGAEKFGKTTITWDTGGAPAGEVYVLTNGKEEKKFSGAKAKGSQEATWIGKGEYEFKLYEGKEHTKVLGTVKVVRSK